MPFWSRKNDDRDLDVPAEVQRASVAREVLRVWLANDGLVCSLRPDAWDDATAWGIVLTDVARHVANAMQQLKGDDPATTLDRIRTVFNNELDGPTAEPTGRFE